MLLFTRPAGVLSILVCPSSLAMKLHDEAAKEMAGLRQLVGERLHMHCGGLLTGVRDAEAGSDSRKD